MKSSLSCLLVLLICVGLCGCPYESKVPLDKPTVNIDSALLGKWENPLHRKDTYIISKQDDYIYNIEAGTDSGQAYISLVNGVIFLNLFERKPASIRKYSFCRIDVSERDIMIVSTVTENVAEQFVSSETLKKFFADNMMNSYFFERGKTVLLRIGK